MERRLVGAVCILSVLVAVGLAAEGGNGTVPGPVTPTSTVAPTLVPTTSPLAPPTSTPTPVTPMPSTLVPFTVAPTAVPIPPTDMPTTPSPSTEVPLTSPPATPTPTLDPRTILVGKGGAMVFRLSLLCPDASKLFLPLQQGFLTAARRSDRWGGQHRSLVSAAARERSRLKQLTPSSNISSDYLVYYARGPPPADSSSSGSAELPDFPQYTEEAQFVNQNGNNPCILRFVVQNTQPRVWNTTFQVQKGANVTLSLPYFDADDTVYFPDSDVYVINILSQPSCASVTPIRSKFGGKKWKNRIRVVTSATAEPSTCFLEFTVMDRSNSVSTIGRATIIVGAARKLQLTMKTRDVRVKRANGYRIFRLYGERLNRATLAFHFPTIPKSGTLYYLPDQINKEKRVLIAANDTVANDKTGAVPTSMITLMFSVSDTTVTQDYTDSFTYYITDGQGAQSEIGTVTLRIQGEIKGLQCKDTNKIAFVNASLHRIFLNYVDNDGERVNHLRLLSVQGPPCGYLTERGEQIQATKSFIDREGGLAFASLFSGDPKCTQRSQEGSPRMVYKMLVRSNSGRACTLNLIINIENRTETNAQGEVTARTYRVRVPYPRLVRFDGPPNAAVMTWYPAEDDAGIGSFYTIKPGQTCFPHPTDVDYCKNCKSCCSDLKGPRLTQKDRVSRTIFQQGEGLPKDPPPECQNSFFLLYQPPLFTWRGNYTTTFSFATVDDMPLATTIDLTLMFRNSTLVETPDSAQQISVAGIPASDAPNSPLLLRFPYNAEMEMVEILSRQTRWLHGRRTSFDFYQVRDGTKFGLGSQLLTHRHGACRFGRWADNNTIMVVPRFNRGRRISFKIRVYNVEACKKSPTAIGWTAPLIPFNSSMPVFKTFRVVVDLPQRRNSSWEVKVETPEGLDSWQDVTNDFRVELLVTERRRFRLRHGGNGAHTVILRRAPNHGMLLRINSVHAELDSNPLRQGTTFRLPTGVSDVELEFAPFAAGKTDLAAVEDAAVFSVVSETAVIHENAKVEEGVEDSVKVRFLVHQDAQHRVEKARPPAYAALIGIIFLLVGAVALTIILIRKRRESIYRRLTSVVS